MDSLAIKRSFDQVVLGEEGLVWTDPVNARIQAVLLGDCVLSNCKCLHVHAFLIVSFDRLETRIKESNRQTSFFVGAKLASALKAPAWTSAQATDCDL